MSRLSLKNLNIKDKKVLIRVDFNVPLDKSGNITDDSRIEASLPTIRYVIEKGGYPILMSHLGRPKGKRVPELSLAPCAKQLMTMLGKPVIMAQDCIGDKIQELTTKLKLGEILLLENLRFYAAEEDPALDPSFAKKLADLGDIYVNDAFGTAHRVHSSTTIVVNYFLGRAAAGFLLEKELKFLGEALLRPRRPFYAIIGGAKVSNKIGVLKSLIKKVDVLLIGGAMAYTFLKAEGIAIGNSLYEADLLDQAKGIMDSYKTAGVGLQLPIDHIVVNKVDRQATINVVDNSKGIPSGFIAVDIGPATVEKYIQELKHAATVFWNGPVGMFEISNFAKGTYALASALADIKAVKIIGGGDSIAAIKSANLSHRFTHLSTGGGASLEFLEFGTLPGIEALENAAAKTIN
jgi:phosphoglycerate kinase